MDLNKAELIAIGDELLYGQTLDTNSHWISGKLDAIGVKTVRRTTVGDNESDILKAFAEAESRANIILITGGLGPTSDDLTKPCLVKYFDTHLVRNEEALREITALFESRGRVMTQINADQALLPANCEKVTNKRGTAPGMWFRKGHTVFVSMPGVPYEMKTMMEEIVLPKIQETFALPVIYHKIVRTIGIGESWLADMIKSWEEALPSHIKLAYLPSVGQVKLRLTANGADLDKLKGEIDIEVNKLLPIIMPYVYGFDVDIIEKTIGEMLRDRGESLSVAESCSGGYLAHMITSVPGSSDYFVGGMVSYHNSIKTEHLGVSSETLATVGAVSEETASQMAMNIRRLYKTTYGLATTGIAGPGGAVDGKPVGTVWIACADENEVVTRKLQLGNEREIVIELAAMNCLNMLRQQIEKKVLVDQKQ